MAKKKRNWVSKLLKPDQQNIKEPISVIEKKIEIDEFPNWQDNDFRKLKSAIDIELKNSFEQSYLKMSIRAKSREKSFQINECHQNDFIESEVEYGINYSEHISHKVSWSFNGNDSVLSLWYGCDLEDESELTDVEILLGTFGLDEFILVPQLDKLVRKYFAQKGVILSAP